jgi:hypothetical protein
MILQEKNKYSAIDIASIQAKSHREISQWLFVAQYLIVFSGLLSRYLQK